MNIVFIGKPGSGKGTAAAKLAKDLGYKLLVAGDLLREERNSGSKLGKQIKKLIDKGNLVPDEMINEIIINEVKKPTKLKEYHIIDGYPRTAKQAKFLDDILNVSRVFYLDAKDEVITKRILERGKTSGRADDQDKDIIKIRLENYYNEIKPILNHYDDRIIKIDASKSVDEVYEQIIEHLEFEERVLILEKEFEEENKKD